MSKAKKYRVKLKPLDMSRSKEHSHPDISSSKNYLCLIGGEFYAGQFNREWYGLNFDGWCDGLQFDEPGTNGSDWQQIWEITAMRAV